MEQKRQYNLDLLRIIACFMVVILHVSAQNWDKASLESIDWQILNVYDVLVRSAVPLFFMLSGKLFLTKDDISLKRLFSKNILKIVFLYLFWSLLYAIEQVGVGNIVSSPDFKTLFDALVGSKYHLWYLTSLFSVYLLVPVFIGLKSYKDGKILNYIAALFFVFAIVKSSVLLLPVSESFKELLQRFGFIFDTFAGYFIIGYILDKYKEKLRKIPTFILWLAFFAAAAATAAGSYSLSVKAGEGVSVLYGYFFVSTFIEAAAIFLLFLRMPERNMSEKAKKIITKASKYTLFVYLAHPYFIDHLDLWFGLDSLSFSPIISVPAISAIIFILCSVAAVILDKIPFIRKILL